MTIAELDKWLTERNLNGFWNRPHSSDAMKPYHWKWEDIHEGIQRAMELVPMDETGRRVVQPRNPTLSFGMSRTIHLAVQAVLPGEFAKAHRHVAAAIRYVIQGSPKCFTIVEGERFPMERGDLITTPNWTWHDHLNASDEPVLWVDGLDARLVSYFDANLFENFKTDQQKIEKPEGYSSTISGHLRPKWVKSHHATPPFRYSWRETQAILETLKRSEGDPYDSIQLEYTNPFTLGPTLPTFTCNIQLLLGGQKTQNHRHMSTTVYFVHEGKGRTTVEDVVFNWSKGDFFLIPPWQRHCHANKSGQDAILFSIDDAPAMIALGIYREDTDNKL